MDIRRKLFVMRPLDPASGTGFEKIVRDLSSLSPEVINPTGAEQIIALDGHVVVIPVGSWPDGVLAGLTRCADLLAVGIVKPNDDIDRVRLWYHLGAQLVVDSEVSTAVLKAALERLLEVESESWRPKLTRRESMIFEVLRRNGPAGLSRAEISKQVWSNVSVHEKTIDVHVFNLRRKLNSTRYRIACIEQRFILIEAARAPEVESETNAKPQDQTGAVPQVAPISTGTFSANLNDLGNS